MTPTAARLWTLKEIVDFCTEEQKKYQSERYHVYLSDNPFTPPIPVKIISTIGGITEVENELGKRKGVSSKKVEERQDIDSKYHALQDVIDKCNELMNSISVAA